MLTLKNLPWRNLKGYAGRTAALLLFAALMAVAVFGGTMMIGGVRNGLDTVKSRLGADIMVTPASAKNEVDAQTVLLKKRAGDVVNLENDIVGKYVQRLLGAPLGAAAGKPSGLSLEYLQANGF
jgi:riboflavin synthase alpha subunit